MAFSLPDLPYDREALAPFISAETLDYHHGKHHQAYRAGVEPHLLLVLPESSRRR